MSTGNTLDRLADQAGIVAAYRDLAGVHRQTSRETKLALLRANGWQLDNEAMIEEALRSNVAAQAARLLPEEIIVGTGTPLKLKTPKPVIWRLICEGQETDDIEGKATETINLPSLPSGIHHVTVTMGKHQEAIRLIAAPATAPSLTDIVGRERIWGSNLALYGAHSKRNPGIGDYRDLAVAAEAFSRHGADFLGINPVHAIGWASSEVISPYSPSHRGYLNTSHIALDQIEPQSETTRSLFSRWNEQAAKASTELIDYREHANHHRPLLRAIFDDHVAMAAPEENTAFQIFRERQGAALQRFTRFESQSETHGTDWHNWPAEPQRPAADASVSNNSQMFHAWLQWQAETQLQAAQSCACSSGMALGLYLDLAVGSRRNGAEAWGEPDSIAEGVSVGAPPDHLSPAGQNWNLAAYAPRKLASTHYGAFRSILARNMSRCGILRIDHVLGLNRSFWIPDDGSPGGYIRQNLDALLAIVRIEAERNSTIVIGEDLGLVPDGFREALRSSGIYSYSVLQYEKDKSGSFRDPSRLRPHSLSCFGTHDTPTLRGFAAGRDIECWKRLGWISDLSAKDAHRKRQGECEQLANLEAGPAGDNGMTSKSESRKLSDTVHSALARSPVAMVSVQLDDIEGRADAQNLPGTIDEHPNWQRRSKTPVDELSHFPNLQHMGRMMRKNGRSNRKLTATDAAD